MADPSCIAATKSGGCDIYSLAPEMCQTSRDRVTLFETATLRYQNVVRGARASGVTEMEAKTSETASKKRRRGRSYYRKKLNHDMIFESALKKLRTGLEHTEQVQKYTPNPLSNPNSRASRTGMALFPWDTMPTAADVVGGGLPPDRAPRKRQQLLRRLPLQRKRWHLNQL